MFLLVVKTFCFVRKCSPICSHGVRRWKMTRITINTRHDVQLPLQVCTRVYCYLWRIASHLVAVRPLMGGRPAQCTFAHLSAPSSWCRNYILTSFTYSQARVFAVSHLCSQTTAPYKYAAVVVFGRRAPYCYHSEEHRTSRARQSFICLCLCSTLVLALCYKRK